MAVLTLSKLNDLEPLMKLKISQLKLEVTYQIGGKLDSTMWIFGTFSHKISL